MADQYRLEQVLTAILSKASAATAENGSIQISLIEQEKTVTLRIWGHPQLTKEDTANAPQDRYSNEETASIELALCRYLIKLHKGKLWLPNDKTSGNAFVLVLPSITN
jgi:signal transduction histidine kinase